ncbi:MAG: hypothetical protein QOF36_1430 [Microbacteriaceae bacterium]|nr:hypothetical protein [Microbacteriaceae bacterium]
MAEDTHEFDPRFDPAFQRGYRPKAGDTMRVERRPAAEPKQTAELQQARPQQAQPPQPAESRSPVEPPRRPSENPLATVKVVIPEPADEPGLEQASAEGWGDEDARGPLITPALSRNPSVLALWIIGAGSIVIGVVLYLVSATMSTSGSGSDQFQMALYQLGWVFATPLVTVGLATIVGLLFLSAVRSLSAR